MKHPLIEPQVDWLLCLDSPLLMLKKHWLFQLGMIFRTRDPTVLLLTAWKQNQQGWPAGSRGILEYAGIDTHQCDLGQYLGTYRWRNGAGSGEWVIIGSDDVNKCLYTSLFWPRMPMRWCF
jgi:hypothetical protein